MMRSSALSLALGYVALGIAALVLFAAPLWYAWQVTIQDGRSEILQADAQRLTDVYRREGGEGLKNFIDARVDMQIAGDRILLLADASLKPLAGNLAAWPRDVPAAAGNYRIKVDLGDHGIQNSLVHVDAGSATTCCSWAATTSCSRRSSAASGTGWPPPSRCCPSRASWSASSRAAP